MTAAGFWTRLFRGADPEEDQLARTAEAAGFGLVPLSLPADRLDKLRSSITGAWESALIFGGGDYLEQVWIPQYIGLVDVARAAEGLYLHPDDADARAYLRRQLDDYVKDLEIAKLRRDIYGRAADERFDKVRRLEKVAGLARALLAAAEPVIEDEYLRADYETTRGQLEQALGAVDAKRERPGVTS